MTILFVEQFYYPDLWGGAVLPRDITCHLRRTGHDVEVICGSEPYVEGMGEFGTNPSELGIRLRRVPRLLKGGIHQRKLLRQLWFCLAMVPLLFLRRPPAAFVTQTNPPLAVVLVALAARVFRRPLVIVAQDVYPESLVVHGLIRGGGWMDRALSGVFRWAYRNAKTVVALGPCMRDRLIRKGVAADRIEIISNWATGAEGIIRGPENRFLHEWGLRDRFVLLYSGNLGVGHEFDALLDGLVMARRDVPELALVFIGRGSRMGEVQRSVAVRNLDDIVQFREFVAAGLLPESLGVADLAVVTLRDGFEGLMVPSKLFGYMSRGLPVLYIGPASDVSAIVEESDCGYVARAGDVAAIQAAITSAARNRRELVARGNRGRIMYEARLAKAHGLARYEAVMARATAAYTP
ncbi:MAG: glycosyltransferase family 4 protein [Gammaproteobacteria bacterium]|nr:MAG: glycosyltransferase family 4 protein [Gammaproteobacteria bacterium]